jgi:large subunit ribosomal protein L25
LPDDVEPTITDRDFTVATIASPGGGVKNEDEDEDADGDGEGAEDAASDD